MNNNMATGPGPGGDAGRREEEEPVPGGEGGAAPYDPVKDVLVKQQLRQFQTILLKGLGVLLLFVTICFCVSNMSDHLLAIASGVYGHALAAIPIVIALLIAVYALCEWL